MWRAKSGSMVGIRPATPADAKAIREVALASWHAAYDDLIGEETVEKTIAKWYAIDDLRAVIDQPGHVVRVAEDGLVIGFAHTGPQPGDERVAELIRIYVRPERWGDGIGDRLLESVELELADYDRLALFVLAANDVGIGFYEKQGFECVEEDTIEIGGDEYREHRYEKPL